MRLLERDGENLVFRMTQREKTLLERLIGFFPLRRTSVARLSRDENPDLAEADALLRESQRESTCDLETWIARRFHDGELFLANGKEWKLALAEGETDRLLRVLNELRVSAWEKLGRPEDLDSSAPTAEAALAAAPLHALMMLAGQFQIVLIRAMQGELDPPSSPPPASG